MHLALLWHNNDKTKVLAHLSLGADADKDVDTEEKDEGQETMVTNNRISTGFPSPHTKVPVGRD